MSYQNHGILVDLTPSTMVLQPQAQAVPPIRVCVDDKTTTMHAGHTYWFTLGTSGSAARQRTRSLIPREAAPRSVQ